MSAVGPRNLARLADEALERRGDHPTMWQDGVWRGSRELWERGARLGSGLAARGVQPGDRVVVMMENTPEVPAIYQAVWRAGGVIVPAIFLLSVEELRGLAYDSGASAAITSPVFRETVDAAVEELPAMRWVASTGAELDELAGPGPGPIVPRGDADLAALVYTGGTTGRSKGVMLTHANLWEAGRAGQLAGDVPGVTRSLTSLPLSHSYGILVLCVSMHGDQRPETVLMRWFEPEAWLKLAQEHRTQISAVVPSMLYLLLTQPLEEYDLSELRYVVSGAAPLGADAIEAFTRRVPGAEIREGYGLTESSALCSTNRPGASKAGTVGPPMPGTEVRICDEAGNDVASGEPGEVCIRSESVMAGYWNAPEQTAETIRDGWLRTGDVGRLDGDGHLLIVDRIKDLILRGGFNVFPRDVEEALLEHPAVSMACVVGRPDEVHGEEVVAFVTVAPGSAATVDDLLAFGKERLGAYRYPREIHVLPELPLTPVGKADRKALRTLLTTEGALQ